MSVGVPDKPLSSTICCENSSDFDKKFLRALIGLHALLECDSVTAFYGIGKRKWLKVTKSAKMH